MANPAHVELVRQGAEAIRRWLAENPDVKLDLSGANLSDADLRGANLQGANLEEARLRRADLRNALLGHVSMGKADLGEANLRGANLGGATLRGANLSRTDLYHAHLRKPRQNFRYVYGWLSRPSAEALTPWPRLRYNVP
jgi:uncharacterized protein YjbI with pentapeptide repeats